MTRVPAAQSSNQVGFSEMSFAQAGLRFSNTLDDQTVLKNQNLMLGSGVSAGDFDGDGWCDLYFTAINGRTVCAWPMTEVRPSAARIWRNPR